MDLGYSLHQVARAFFESPQKTPTHNSEKFDRQLRLAAQELQNMETGKLRVTLASVSLGETPRFGHRFVQFTEGSHLGISAKVSSSSDFCEFQLLKKCLLFRKLNSQGDHGRLILTFCFFNFDGFSLWEFLPIMCPSLRYYGVICLQTNRINVDSCFFVNKRMAEISWKTTQLPAMGWMSMDLFL